MMVDGNANFVWPIGNQTTNKDPEFESLIADKEPTEPHLRTSLEGFDPRSELGSFMVGIKSSFNFSTDNETLAFLFTILNNTSRKAAIPIHPCDIGFRDGYKVGGTFFLSFYSFLFKYKISFNTKSLLDTIIFELSNQRLVISLQSSLN